MYTLLKPLLFSLEPERVHDAVMQGLALTARQKTLLEIVRRYCAVPNSRLEVEAFGLRFPNPVGLAAGMDKNASALPVWAALGFGFAEIGSVTAHPQPGNDAPRMFRLPADEAIVNRMGFNNHGSSLVAQTLGRWQRSHGQPRVPLGINLGKSKMTSLEDAPGDYLLSLARLWGYGDYFVVNVSSPNTPGLRELQDKDRLEELLKSVMGFVNAQTQPKPLLLKIAPDLTEPQLLEILELTDRRGVAGIIATNTTVSRDGLKTDIQEAGGLSGKPLKTRSLEVLRFLRANSSLPIIAVGGISNADDVRERLELGASLVQTYTGFVYEGPLMMRAITRGLLESAQAR
jgi:dihydroorotate dehydrogenase